MSGVRDIIGDLLLRNLVGIVEEILCLTDALTVSRCHLVCTYWNHQFTVNKLWKRLVELRSARDRTFRLTCRLNGWRRWMPSLGGVEQPAHVYKAMHFKSSQFPDLICRSGLDDKKLFTGTLFSCLKVHKEYLFAGMLDGLVKMWLVKPPVRNEKPIRVFEGHKERVTALDTRDEILLSSSLDHSVRVWNFETGGLLRVLRGPGAPLLLVKFTSDRVISLSKSGQLSFWYWASLTHVDYLYSTAVDHDINFIDVGIGETYIVLVLHDPLLSGEKEMHVYSSKTGRRLLDKKIACPNSGLCMDVLGNLLCMGSGAGIELWNLEDCQLVNTLQVRDSPTSGLVYVKNVSVSDYMLVAMLSTGTILIWPLLAALDCTSGCAPDPEVRIDNVEPCWRSIIAISDTKIAFGLEMKFGDIKIYSFIDRMRLEEAEEERGVDHVEVTEPTGLHRSPPWEKTGGLFTKRGCTFSCCNFIAKNYLLSSSIDSIPDLK